MNIFSMKSIWGESQHRVNTQKLCKPWNTMAFPKVLVCTTWYIIFVWSAFLTTFPDSLISTWIVCPTWRTLWEHVGKAISDFYGLQTAQGREEMTSPLCKWPVFSFQLSSSAILELNSSYGLLQVAMTITVPKKSI